MVTTASPQALLGWMEGIGDPVRLRVLRILEGRELGVADMVAALRLPQSTVSRHLKVLSDRGFVQSRPQGPTNLYSLAPRNGDGGSARLWALAKEQTEGWATAKQDLERLHRRLESARRSSRAFFEGAAGRWERLREEAYGRTFQQSALLDLLPADWVVADLGCGTGSLVANLAPHVARAIGVDESAAMMAAARSRVAGLDNVELRTGTLENLPLRDGECDAALLVLVLGYVADPTPVLGEMARVLRPGGRAVVIEALPHSDEEFRVRMGQQHSGIAREALEAGLRAAGLRITRLRELAPEAEASGPALILASAVRGGVPSLSRRTQGVKAK